MTMTKHAQERWNERFPELDLKAEWTDAFRSHRVGTSVIKQIRKQCREHLQVTKKTFKGYYYKMSRNNVVFVITPPETVVTVFPMVKPQSQPSCLKSPTGKHEEDDIFEKRAYCRHCGKQLR